MEKIIINKDNLKDNEITEIKRKVKILLVNSNDEIMLAYSHNEYQFPGGTNEIGEELIDTINREIKEETGISLKISKIDPFACNIGYYKDWPAIGKNRKIEIYYYEIKTDQKPILNELNLTDNEKDGNFELRFVNLNDVENVLQNNVLQYGDPHSITKEMLDLFVLYKNNKINDLDL